MRSIIVSFVTVLALLPCVAAQVTESVPAQDKKPPKSLLEQVLQAEDADREAALVAFIKDKLLSRAIYSGHMLSSGPRPSP